VQGKVNFALTSSHYQVINTFVNGTSDAMQRFVNIAHVINCVYKYDYATTLRKAISVITVSVVVKRWCVSKLFLMHINVNDAANSSKQFQFVNVNAQVD